MQPSSFEISRTALCLDIAETGRPDVRRFALKISVFSACEFPVFLRREYERKHLFLLGFPAEAAISGRRAAKFPVFSRRIREIGAEKGSLATAPSAT